MSIEAGAYRLGPDNATLAVNTARRGAAAKAGHDLVMHVTRWDAILTLDEQPSATRMELNADDGSLRVQSGTGGIQPLGDEERSSIHTTIDDEVLMRRGIEFHSTSAEGDASRMSVEGELTLAGTTHPIAFDLTIADDGAVDATATVTQSAWGIKPYTALFGALKVADEVEVVLEGRLQSDH